MPETIQPTTATPETPQKKAYHSPDLRDFGTVKELTLTGSTPDTTDYTGNDYVTGNGSY